MDAATKSKEAQKTTIYGALIDILLGFIKIIIGVLYGSHALVVDGIHSFSDLLTDVFVLIIAKFSHEEPDDEHPYGHGRFESLGTVAMGSILIGVSGIIAYENLVKLFIADNFIIPAWPTLIAALLSIGLKEWAYQFQVKVGKKIGSRLIVANAWHSRSDALSSLAVFIGIIFSMFGLVWLDTVMAIVVAIMIGKIGWDFLWNSVKELVDTSIEPDFKEKVEQTILSIDGVISMHNLRSRKIGDKAILDVNIEVPPRISVSEGHEIATYVTKNLIERFDDIMDVTVHTDVEDDRVAGEDYHQEVKELLPLRNKIMEHIGSDLYNLIDPEDILDMNIHYKGQSITLSLFISENNREKYNHEIVKKLNQKCNEVSWLERIDLYFKVEDV